MGGWDIQDFGRRSRPIAGAIGVAVLTLPAGVAAAPDVELGRYLSQECVTCHRGATATSTIPNIFGMAEKNLAELIKAYRDKRLDNAAMQNVAARLKDDEIEALAAYFARTTRP